MGRCICMYSVPASNFMGLIPTSLDDSRPTPIDLQANQTQIDNAKTVCNQSLILNPINNPVVLNACRLFGLKLLPIQINVPNFMTHLEKCQKEWLRDLGECWGGGKFAPAGKDCHEITLNFFPQFFPSQAQVEELFLSYLRNLIPNPPPDWVLRAAYLSQTDYISGKEAVYVLNTAPSLCSKIHGENTFYSTSAEDGVFISLKRPVLRCSLGSIFASTMHDAKQALAYHYSRIVTRVKLLGRMNLFFPVISARARGCLVDHEITAFSVHTLLIWRPKASKENIIRQMKEMLRTIPHFKGKMFLYLNMLTVVRHKPYLCRIFAEGWLSYLQELGLDYQNDFAQLILSCRGITPCLIEYFRTLFMFEWADGRIQAFTDRVVPDGIKNLRYKSKHPTIVCNVEGIDYHLALHKEASPNALCLDGVHSFDILFDHIQRHSSPRYLHGFFSLFNIDPKYLNKGDFIAKIPQIFSSSHVRNITDGAFRHHPKIESDTLHRLLGNNRVSNEHLVSHHQINQNFALSALDSMVASSKYQPLVSFNTLVKGFFTGVHKPDDQFYKIMIAQIEGLINDPNFKDYDFFDDFVNCLSKLMLSIINNPQWKKQQVFGLYKIMSKELVLSEDMENEVVIRLIDCIDEFTLEESCTIIKEALERRLLSPPCLNAFKKLIESNDPIYLICANKYINILFEHNHAAHESVVQLIRNSLTHCNQWAFTSLLKYATRLKKENYARFQPDFIKDVSEAVKKANVEYKAHALKVIEIIDLLLDFNLEKEHIDNIVVTISALIGKPPKILVKLVPVIKKLVTSTKPNDLPLDLRSKFINISLTLAAHDPHPESNPFKQGQNLLRSTWKVYKLEAYLQELYKNMVNLLSEISDPNNLESFRQFKAYALLATEVTVKKAKQIFFTFAQMRGITDFSTTFFRKQFAEATKELFAGVEISRIPGIEETKEAVPPTATSHGEETKEAIPTRRETFDSSEDFREAIAEMVTLSTLVNTSPREEPVISRTFHYVLLSLRNRKVLPTEASRLITTNISCLIQSKRKLYINYAEQLFHFAQEKKLFTPEQVQAFNRDFMGGYILLSTKYNCSDRIFKSFRRLNLNDKRDIDLALDGFQKIQEAGENDISTANEFLSNLLLTKPENPAIREKIILSYITLLNICRKGSSNTLYTPAIQLILSQLFSADWVGHYHEVLIPFILKFTRQVDDLSIKMLFGILSAKRFFIHFNADQYMALIDIIHSKNKSHLLDYLRPFIQEAFSGEEEKGNFNVQLNRKAAIPVLLHFIVTVAKMVSRNAPLFKACSKLFDKSENVFYEYSPVLCDKAAIFVHCRANDQDKAKSALQKTLKTSELNKEAVLKVFKEATESITYYDLALARQFQGLAKEYFYADQALMFRLVCTFLDSENQEVCGIGSEMFMDYIKALKIKDINFCTYPFIQSLIDSAKEFGKLKILLEIRVCLRTERVSLSNFDRLLDSEIETQDFILKARSVNNLEQAREIINHFEWMLVFYVKTFPEKGQEAVLEILNKLTYLEPRKDRRIALREFDNLLQKVLKFNLQKNDYFKEYNLCCLFERKRMGSFEVMELTPDDPLPESTTKSVIKLMKLLAREVSSEDLDAFCGSFMNFERFCNDVNKKDVLSAMGRAYLKLATCVLMKTFVTGNQKNLTIFIHGYFDRFISMLNEKDLPPQCAILLTLYSPLLSHLVHRLCYLVPMMCKVKEGNLYENMKKGSMEERLVLLKNLLNDTPFSQGLSYNEQVVNGYLKPPENDLDNVLQDVAKAMDLCESPDHFNRLTSFQSLALTIDLFLKFAPLYVACNDKLLTFKRTPGKLNLDNLHQMKKAWPIDKPIIFKLFFSIIYPMLPPEYAPKFIDRYKQTLLKTTGIETDFIKSTQDKEEKARESKVAARPSVQRNPASHGAGPAAAAPPSPLVAITAAAPVPSADLAAKAGKKKKKKKGKKLAEASHNVSATAVSANLGSTGSLGGAGATATEGDKKKEKKR